MPALFLNWLPTQSPYCVFISIGFAWKYTTIKANQPNIDPGLKNQKFTATPQQRKWWWLGGGFKFVGFVVGFGFVFFSG